MSGNVWEWCWELFDERYRRLRGGSWFIHAVDAQVAFRDISNNPGNRDNSLGFRLARSSGQ
jgi:formylglycine-generating enzyme required for sulfatase activity